MELAGEEILNRLGQPYASSITLEASSAAESAALLREVAIVCCERWAPAIVYDYHDSVLSLDDLLKMRADGRTFADLDNEWHEREEAARRG